MADPGPILPRLRSYLRQHHIGLLALFVALGGSAYAGTTIRSKDVANNSLTSNDIRNSSLTGKDVRNSSLAGTDVRNSSLTGADVKNDSLTGEDILESSLGTVPRAGAADVAGAANTANTVGGFGAGAFAIAVRSNQQPEDLTVNIVHRRDCLSISP